MVTGSEDEDMLGDQVSRLEKRNSEFESADDKEKPLDETTLYAVNADLCPVDPVCGNSNGQILKLMSNYTTELKRISLLQPEELGSTEPQFNLLQNYCTWNNSHVRFSLLRSKTIDDLVSLKLLLFSLLAMIAHSTVPSFTWTLFPLLSLFIEASTMLDITKLFS